ncbi:hypothetical protein DPMN_165566 [Dreissena polymorpha]|uniref:Uncharacterized protein n=1 Tax=Dreissena polymorpha TaxID=45954 RepID=A0A9D4F0W4_DREPO|nr:hypothetical protein DPMN_165566 [Dreissena polymorpha]
MGWGDERRLDHLLQNIEAQAAEFVFNHASVVGNYKPLVAKIGGRYRALLGYDILKGRDGVPADILLSSNRILLDGLEIPLFQVGKSNSARRVTVAKDMTLPGSAEAVVSGFVGRFKKYDDEINSNFLVEPAKQFQDRYALRMAATLVDVNT